MRANTPNVFLKGGSGDDALQVTGGNNVIDGGGGSNFLVGGTGADGGTDTFFIDGRGGAVTWSSVVNFHRGDAVTIFGFTAGTSTLPFTASDGAAGYTGATLHSELSGAGTGVNGSVTFAGISLADAQTKFTISTGNVGGADYLQIAYTG
jgi:Ca2+-binding RTX toxin-like protein